MLIVKPGPWPPGGFPFSDPRTGMRFAGMGKDFAGRVAEIQAHRLSNPNFYPPHESGPLSREAIGKELNASICSKHPSFCMETVPIGPPMATTPQPEVKPPSTKCPSCGADDWETNFCPTCGGRKIDGYTCKKCGHQRRR